MTRHRGPAGRGRARIAALVIASLTCRTDVVPAQASGDLQTVPQRNASPLPPEGASVALSADGRFVVFASYAPLLSAEGSGHSEIYVLDRATGALTRESRAADEPTAARDAVHPGVSADGRYVVFASMGPPDFLWQVQLRDRHLGTTRILSRRGGDEGNGPSRHPVISADGQVVAFDSTATNLVDDAAETRAHGTSDVYVVQVATGAIARVTVDDAGHPRSGGGSSFAPSLSADGRYVAFTSTVGLGLDDDPRRPNRLRTDIYVRDLQRALTRRVSRTASGQEANGRSYAPSLSGNGRLIAFVSEASNLVPDDRNKAADIFCVDLETSVVALVSRSVRRGTANGRSAHPAISADGRVIAFQSEASDLTCGPRCPAADDINLLSDVFVFDRDTGLVRRLSGDGPAGWMEPSYGPAVDAHGTMVAFSSRHPVDTLDTANDLDVFVLVP
jgi:Tol biopolymer transport system component